ncbi:hypothetical protein [Halopiger aswanensis]|uniref:Uncharacterized protein n=1 Tax=Halopiger aswanensis TaxID=148449 RepID=A0A3R7GTT0_9EURY|nr:hypothetical protein [Halopiger aswanensis]RKD89261.1 hypothetical protein ATJ93_4093 [Halopiger aswanensis]
MDRTRPVLKFVFGINVLFLVLLGFSYPYLEPGTGSYVVATMTAALCLLMLAIVAILTYFQIDVFDHF